MKPLPNYYSILSNSACVSPNVGNGDLAFYGRVNPYGVEEWGNHTDLSINPLKKLWNLFQITTRFLYENAF